MANSVDAIKKNLLKIDSRMVFREKPNLISAFLKDEWFVDVEWDEAVDSVGDEMVYQNCRWRLTQDHVWVEEQNEVLVDGKPQVISIFSQSGWLTLKNKETTWNNTYHHSAESEKPVFPKATIDLNAHHTFGGLRPIGSPDDPSSYLLLLGTKRESKYSGEWFAEGDSFVLAKVVHKIERICFDQIITNKHTFKLGGVNYFDGLNLSTVQRVK
jgi:hypothetical protein